MQTTITSGSSMSMRCHKSCTLKRPKEAASVILSAYLGNQRVTELREWLTSAQIMTLINLSIEHFKICILLKDIKHEEQSNETK